MNDVFVSGYGPGLREFLNSDQVAQGDVNKLGIGVNAFNTRYKSLNPDFTDEDIAKINTISQELLTELKNKAEIPRRIIKPEEYKTYFLPLPDFSTAKNADEKIKMAEEWESGSLAKAKSLVPSEEDDAREQLRYMTNSFIREAVSADNETSWLGDKGYRAVEGAMSMVTPFVPDADRFLAENLPENTGMDEDISSLLFAGAGQLVSQAAIALGTSAVAGPQAGVAAIGTIYSARALVEGYKEEMRKSGNPDKALDVGLAGIPGAALETFADSFTFGLGSEGVSVLKAFKEATTEAAKREVLKAAIPSLGKKALTSGLSEAGVGSVGADFTTGYGRYLASGDESYIPTAEQLAKGALVEGILGAGYTTAFDRPTTEMSNVAKDLKTFSQDKANADEIFKALKSKNYDLAVELATKDYANQPEKKTEASKIISDGIKAPSDEAKAKATSPILPNHRLVLKTKLKEFEKAGDTESAKRISDTLKSVNDGSFTAPESFGLEAVAPGFELTNAPVSIDDGNTVTLKDGTEVESDESLIYVKGISTSSAIVHNVTNNGVGILLDGSDKASLVFGNKTKTGGFSFSQTPKVGYTAVKVNGVHGDSKGKFIVSNFSILGEVSGAKKSEQAVQKTKAVVEKYKNASQDQQKVEYKDSGINDALLVLDTLTATEQLSDDGYEKVEGITFETIEKLEAYANNNPSEASGVEDIINELWDAIPQFKSKVKPVGPVKPVRENQDIFQQRIADQAKLEQSELGIPVQVKDLVGKPVTFNGVSGNLSVDGEMAYVGDVEVSGKDALIQDVEGLSDFKPKDISFTLGPDENGKMFRREADSSGLYKVYEDGSRVKILGRKGGQVKKPDANKNTKAQVVEVKPTVEAVAATPEAVFTSVVEDVAIEHTVEDEVAPVVATLESLKEELAKEQASLASVKSEKFKNTINKKIATIEEEIALLESSGAKDIPTAVQQIKEEIAVDKKEAEAAKKDEDVKISLSPKEDVDGGDVFDQVTFQRKPKLGIKKGQVAVSDVEVTNPRRGDENGYHIFSAGGKSYSVQYYSGFGNGVKKGWYLFNPETNETILIGNNKEEARTSLAKLINNKSPDVGNFVVQDKSNSEILKAVTFTPPKPESVDEKIARLNKAADDAANKVISDKVDAHIATIENETAKKKWSDNKDLIVKFFKATLTDPKNNRTEEFLSLKNIILDRVESLASELDSKVAEQIKKDRSESIDDVVDEQVVNQEEPQSEEDVVDSVDEVLETLTEEDIQEVASELNVDSNLTSVSDALSKAYSDWLVNAKEFSDKLVSILKRVSISLKNKITAIAIAVSILPTILNSSSVVNTKIYDAAEIKSFGTTFRKEQQKQISINFGKIDSLEINVPKSESKVSVPSNIKISFNKETNFNGVKASENVKDASDWILNSSNNEGKPYLIADKVNGLIYVFDKNGKLKKRTYAIFGKDEGDVLKKGKSITPAGVFNASVDNDVQESYYGGTTVDFLDKGETVLAIHRVYLANPSEKRQERLKSKDPTDNRISHGCINVTDAIYDKIIYPEFNSSGGGMIYILPETKEGNKIVERQKVANAGKIRYSISSSTPETSISQEDAQEYIDANGFNVNIEDTQEVTEDGHQWNGRVDFRSGTPVITVNIANISSVEQLRNVINEELGHVAYNVPQIAEILGKIKDTTKLRDEIKDLYKKSDLYEESVVKRMADLVDSYSEKGMFDKLVTAIKSYVKDKLGMELSDADLSYIAYRAINKASKVTKANKNIESKFSYAGEKAEMPQMMRDSLETAKAMAASGKTSEEIRAFTGWFPGKYDGKMRFEVPDNDIKINNEKFKELKVNDSFLMRFGIYEGGISLDQILEGNSKLLDTYPELKNVLIYRVDQYENASFNPGKNAIILPSNSKNSLLHEIQHFIQLKEGFSTGGNASAKFLVNAMSFDKFTSYFNIENMKSGEALMKVFNKLNALRLYKELDNKEKKAILDGDFGKGFDRVKGKNLINKLKDKYGISSSVVSIYDINSNGGVDSYYENESKVFSKLYEEVKEEAAKKLDQSPLSKYALYKSIAGEIESRDVENRSNLTDEQRKIIAPYSSENISKEDAIVMFNNNEESASVNTSTDLDGYTETPDIFSVLTNNITTEQRETFKKIQKMLRKKLEKKLIVDEPAAWSLLKSIKFGFLKQESLKAYNYLLDEFVRTRSKNRDPKSDVRDSAETVIAKASELAKEANQGHFDFLQMKHEFLEDKDFTNDYQGDIDLVMQLAKDDRGHKDSDLPSDKDGETLQTWQIRTLELQDLIFDNLDYVNDRLEEMFPSSNISTSNPILSKYLKVFQNNVDEVIAKQKEMFKSRMNQLMSDPTDKSYRDLRKQYFGLMDFLSDGYALNIEDFITQETADALATKLEDKDIMDMHKAPWRKKWLAGASSFYANTRMLGSKVADITSKLTNNFRSGIMAAERIHDEFTKPVLKEMYESAVAENGGKDFNGQEHNHAGIYSMARAFKSTEGVTEGILNSKRSIETSIKKDIESVWSGRKKAAENHLEFLNNLFVGITKDTPNEEALGILEANAEKILPKGLISYVKGINELFEATKPLAKFTSEFGLGRPFEEWVNYTPSLAITKEGQPIEFDVTEMSVNVSSDESVHGDTNMQRGGGGSMKDRTRRLGNSMVYVFNINHLAENRMRLNLIDYLTLQQRRELNNVISGKGTKHKEFAKLLKDEDGGKERVSHLQTTVRTMWSNTIQSASFISEFQAGVNVFSNMWASGKLASFYQFPGQVASNLAPYFVVNSGSPKRIKYLFDAMGILLKKQMGQTLEPRLDKVVSRILSTVHGRSQEQFLDKSIALDVNGSAVWQQVKTSSFWNQIKGINKLREKILFSQFIYSDMWTGAPMMLANMMAHEEAAGRATSWDGLTFNDESFIKAVDEAERFVGIGASSRRGVWTNNKNGYLVTLRNMLSAFSSHRVNNATNFAIELAKVNDSNTTSEEKAQSVRYMLGIQAQSVVFSVIKWGMVGAFYNLLTASMGDEENEDELEKKYRKLLTDKNISKEQKLTIQAEISMLQKIRNEYEKVKDKNNSYEVLVVRGLQDMVSNSFLIPAATDIPVNALIHNTYDKYEAERFNEVKESELKQLNEKLKKAKDSKNISAAIELQKDISRWESQEAITFVYEGQSIIPFDGVYGGVMKDAAKFVDSASSALLKAEPLSMADVFLGTGLVGLSQPELNKIARLYAKKEEYEAEYKEKIDELKKKKK